MSELEADGVAGKAVARAKPAPTEAKKPKAIAKPTKPIFLPKLEIERIRVRVVGDSELIQHAWSEKAKREMLDKQMGVATAGREKKDPVEDFLQSMYVVEMGKVVGDFRARGADGHPDVTIDGGRFAFPAIAFKAAMVEACTSTGKAITKVTARQAFHIDSELVPIFGQPRMREDMVRLNGTTADIRFRGGFPKWETELDIRFNTRVLTAEQICNLLNIAGFAVGVGEWRSQRDGGFGLFHVSN